MASSTAQPGPVQVSLAFIGALTGVVGDVAGIFGCTCGIPDEVRQAAEFGAVLGVPSQRQVLFISCGTNKTGVAKLVKIFVLTD